MRGTAQRIGDVAVDLSGVATQPVERCTSRLERTVERGEHLDRLVAHSRVNRALEPAQHRSCVFVRAGKTRKREPDEAITVSLGVHEREDRTHRVTEQHHRNITEVGNGNIDQLVEVGDDPFDTIGPGDADTGRRGSAAVSTMVGSEHRVALGVENASDAVVAPGVLGHAVRDDDDRARRAVGKPAPVEDLDAIGIGESELVHPASPTNEVPRPTATCRRPSSESP
jgi:hypothetical protein